MSDVDDPVAAARAANEAITEWIRHGLKPFEVTPVRSKPTPAVVRAELAARLASVAARASDDGRG